MYHFFSRVSKIFTQCHLKDLNLVYCCLAAPSAAPGWLWLVVTLDKLTDWRNHPDLFEIIKSTSRAATKNWPKMRLTEEEEETQKQSNWFCSDLIIIRLNCKSGSFDLIWSYCRTCFWPHFFRDTFTVLFSCNLSKFVTRSSFSPDKPRTSPAVTDACSTSNTTVSVLTVLTHFKLLA